MFEIIDAHVFHLIEIESGFIAKYMVTKSKYQFGKVLLYVVYLIFIICIDEIRIFQKIDQKEKKKYSMETTD